MFKDYNIFMDDVVKYFDSLRSIIFQKSLNKTKPQYGSFDF
jgi:hypothetical protein